MKVRKMKEEEAKEQGLRSMEEVEGDYKKEINEKKQEDGKEEKGGGR